MWSVGDASKNILKRRIAIGEKVTWTGMILAFMRHNTRKHRKTDCVKGTLLSVHTFIDTKVKRGHCSIQGLFGEGLKLGKST